MTQEIPDPRRYVRMTSYLRARIEDGTYQPHELIPSVNKLNAETGYSRHTITKAIRILADEGLIQHVPGLGYGRTGKTTTSHPSQSVVVPITGQARHPDGAVGIDAAPGYRG